MLRFKTFVVETTTSLDGTSRSSNLSKWDTYLVPTWSNKDGYIHSLSKDSKILVDLEDKETLYSASKGAKIKVMSKDVTKSGKSTYAKVKVEGETKAGFVSVGNIKKPDEKNSDDGAVIGGGKNSKEYTPDKFGLGGEEFASSGALVSTVASRMEKKYSGDKYKEIHKYLSEFTKQISGSVLKEDVLKEGKKERFTKVYTTKKTFTVSPSDIKILSKNFGEVLGALYILHTNKKMKIIGFPGNISEGLYDFYGKDSNGRMHYYSVKSAGGSSTSLMNLNFIKKNFAQNNSFVQKYMKQLEAIDDLINYKGRNTVGNITDWFRKVEPGKVKKIKSIMSKTGGVELKSLDKTDLAIWIRGMRKKSNSPENFVKTMKEVYKDVLSDQPGAMPKAEESTLKHMFKTSSSKEYDGGYLIYPLGSYIVSYMNAKEEYREGLNLLADFGSFISQCTVDMDAKSTTIKILKFSKNEFRFSYNAMSKAPGNRPIGFKEI